MRNRPAAARRPANGALHCQHAEAAGGAGGARDTEDVVEVRVGHREAAGRRGTGLDDAVLRPVPGVGGLAGDLVQLESKEQGEHLGWWVRLARELNHYIINLMFLLKLVINRTRRSAGEQW